MVCQAYLAILPPVMYIFIHKEHVVMKNSSLTYVDLNNFYLKNSAFNIEFVLIYPVVTIYSIYFLYMSILAKIVNA